MWSDSDRATDTCAVRAATDTCAVRAKGRKAGNVVAAAAVSLIVGSTAMALPTLVTAPVAGAAGGIDTSSHSAFIKSIAPLAQDAQARYGVPASVSIAQAIQESGWGLSSLTTDYNAYFGIKCSSSSEWANGCVQMRTHEEYDGQDAWITDGFRTYAKPRDSFMDHGQFLRVNGRYSSAFDYTSDPAQFVREIARAGYATESDYASDVLGLMESYDLTKYDKGGAAPSSKPPSTTSAPPKTTEPVPTPMPTPSGTKTPTPTTATPSGTKTPTPTKSSTATPTKSGTATPTKSGTATPTATPSKTGTATPSKTPTPTPTPTKSSTATPSKTPTVTPTPSKTPTAAPVAARKATPTPTPSATSTPKASPASGPVLPPDPNVIAIPKSRDVTPVPVAQPSSGLPESTSARVTGLPSTGN